MHFSSLPSSVPTPPLTTGHLVPSCRQSGDKLSPLLWKHMMEYRNSFKSRFSLYPLRICNFIGKVKYVLQHTLIQNTIR